MQPENRLIVMPSSTAEHIWVDIPKRIGKQGLSLSLSWRRLGAFLATSLWLGLCRERMRPIPSRPEIRVSRGPICPPRSVLRSSCRAEPPLPNEGRILLPLRFLSFDLAGLFFFHLRDTEYISALYHSDSSPEYVLRLDVGREADRDDGDRGGGGRGGQFVSRFE